MNLTRALFDSGAYFKNPVSTQAKTIRIQDSTQYKNSTYRTKAIVAVFLVPYQEIVQSAVINFS